MTSYDTDAFQSGNLISLVETTKLHTQKKTIFAPDYIEQKTGPESMNETRKREVKKKPVESFEHFCCTNVQRPIEMKKKERKKKHSRYILFVFRDI